jgi:hypothetical protein
VGGIGRRIAAQVGKNVRLQVVDHLPGKCEALSANPSTEKKKRKKLHTEESMEMPSESHRKQYCHLPVEFPLCTSLSEA